MTALTTTVGELLKDVYGDTVHDLVNSQDQIYGMVRKEYDEDGDQVVEAHRTGGSISLGYQTENATLPVGDDQQYENSQVRPVEFWATLSLSMRLLRQSKTRRGAFLKGLEGEMKGLAKDIRKFKERVIMGDGSATLGVVGLDPGTGTLLTFADPEDARRFEVGQTIDFYSTRATGATLRANGPETVASINLDAGTLTTAAAMDTTIIVGDVVALAPARTTTLRIEMQGIDSMVLDTDSPMESGAAGGFQGILAPFQFDGTTPNATGVAVWSAPTLDNGGTNRPVTGKLLNQALDAAEIRGNGDIDYFIMSFGPRLEYANVQTNVRRNMNTLSQAGQTGGGFKEAPRMKDWVEYNGRAIIPNRFCRQHVGYGVDWDSFYIKYWAPLQWWDEDGSVVRRSPSRTTSLEAEMYCFEELICDERNANVRLEDLLGDDAA